MRAIFPNGRHVADLRERLLGEMHNIELRQKYLATRSSDCANADLQYVAARLLTVRVARGLLGLALVGAIGGVIGEFIFGTTAKGPGSPLPLLVAIGSMVSGCISFAVLAALGQVVLGEIVGEEKEVRQGQGVGAALGRIAELLAEVACGAIWGAICGMLIGLLIWIVQASVGLPVVAGWESVASGATGGLLLAAIFALFLLTATPSRGAVSRATAWAELGPLPRAAYFFSRALVRRRYLRK